MVGARAAGTSQNARLTALVCERSLLQVQVSIFTVAVLLMLPVDSPSVQFTVNKFLWWAWWQSIVMILQNRCARLQKNAFWHDCGLLQGRGHLPHAIVHHWRAGTSARGCIHGLRLAKPWRWMSSAGRAAATSGSFCFCKLVSCPAVLLFYAAGVEVRSMSN